MAIKKRIDVSPEELISRVDDIASAVAMGYAVYVRRDGKTLFVLVNALDLADLLQVEMFFAEEPGQQDTPTENPSISNLDQSPPCTSPEAGVAEPYAGVTLPAPIGSEQRSPPLPAT